VLTNAVLVVFVEGVHEYLPLTQHQKGTPAYWSVLYRPAGGRDIKGGALG
jgi:hypothetical protein